MTNLLNNAQIRLIEPDDFTDHHSINYQSTMAYLLMRDRPAVFKTGEHELTIEPAPVRKIHWHNKTFDLPYRDNTVTITQDNARITINHENTDSQTAIRGICKMAITCAKHIYATGYIKTFHTSQDTLRSYTSVGAAMTNDFPQERQFLVYSTTENNKRETFALHTPAVSRAIYIAENKIIIHKNSRLIQQLWTCKRTTPDDEYAKSHDSTAREVMALRNKLELYSWNHIHQKGVTAPVGWQYMH